MDFFSPPSLGVAEEVVFVERRNRFEGGVLGSFSIDLMSFGSLWKVYYNSHKFGVNLGFTPGRVPC